MGLGALVMPAGGSRSALTSMGTGNIPRARASQDSWGRANPVPGRSATCEPDWLAALLSGFGGRP